MTDQLVFAIAGIWRQVNHQRCFAIVTCDANELAAPIHPKAIITILRPDDHDRWLTGSYDNVLSPPDWMTVHRPVFPIRMPTPRLT